MPIEESYRDKPFFVEDTDARIRNNDLLTFSTYRAGDALPAGKKAGDFRTIPPGTQVLVSEIKILPVGSEGVAIFARTTSPAGDPIGWTSVKNFKGKFVNETLGVLKPPPQTDQRGPNAVWLRGVFQGQADLIEIVDTAGQVKRLTRDMTKPYLDMVRAANQAGVPLSIVSGFRSYPEQAHLYDGYKKGLPGYNKAAAPGTSPHQNGIALDVAEASAGPGNPTYNWLAKNATGFGFLRTVDGEPWHWEHDEKRAKDASDDGTFKIPKDMTP